MIENSQSEISIDDQLIIKIAGLYQYKDGSNNWLLINRKVSKDTYLVHDFMLDDGDYDVDICEMSIDEIKAVADLSKCWNGKFKKGYLYAVWDGGNKETYRIIYTI